MKKKNCCCEFASERSEALLKNFRESIARQSVISARKAFHDAAAAPAPRFWVSEARAVRIIRELLKGNFEILDGMRPEKRRMFLEIFKRVEKALAKTPQRPLGDIVFDIVNSPAPSSYMTWVTASKLIYRLRSRKF